MKILKQNPLPGSLFALFLLIMAIACKKDKTADLSTQFMVSQAQTYEFKQGENVIVTVALTTVQDSRCPINADCVSAGYGMVTLKIKDLSIGSEKNLNLYIGGAVPNGQKDLAPITLNGTNYIIQLKDISPFPQLNMPQIPSSARLSLTKI
ncbi:hypothetical protein VRU48_00415 [Pedobacter sp. KR3-3]|uniref:Lipoprotein n=1 Tax=Pedobacter albus TaxID=3113905 RepID=A0ABU7I263_9SPHI|nr:hypothetical protein [Pedobacter sp. KR3-3]MEE1943548.1 hypothetical protein [Pedobacter sp. KR3-3]